MPAAGYYCNEQDLINRYNATNIAAWSQADGSSTINEVAEQAAFDQTDSKINTILAQGPYSTPLSFGPMSGNAIRSNAVDIAAWILYSAYGMRDGDTIGSKLLANYESATAWFWAVKGELVTIDSGRRWPAPSAPICL